MFPAKWFQLGHSINPFVYIYWISITVIRTVILSFSNSERQLKCAIFDWYELMINIPVNLYGL